MQIRIEGRELLPVIINFFDINHTIIYRKKVLPETYKIVRTKISKDLEECAKLSFTTDSWSGPSDNFLSLVQFY